MPRLATHLVDVHVFRRRPEAEFLLLRRAASGWMGGTWQILHGKIQDGESAARAALRELGEETALTPLAFWQLESVNTFFAARSDELYLCPGFAVEVAADADPTLNPEHDAFRWNPAGRAERELMWPGERTALHEILHGIIAAGPAEPHLRIDLRAVR